MTIEHVIKQMKARVLNTQKQQAQLNCRSFVRKLGYKARSQTLIEKVNEEMAKAGLAFRFQNGETSWKQVAIDDTLYFVIASSKASPRIERSANTLPCLATPRKHPLYGYQLEAIRVLHHAYAQKQTLKGLLVLPTGGGKTTTAVEWLVDEALLKGKQVLWLAHRHELLNQAYESFKRALSYRKGKDVTVKIISGKHDRAATLTGEEQLIIASKDSLMQYVSKVGDRAAQLFVVIDEAHHAPARTYRELLQALQKQVRTMTLLGLTATPYRTSEDEAGSMKAVFRDGILFKRDLKTLISAGIVSAPIFHDLRTDVKIDTTLSKEAKEKLAAFDQLPESITAQLVSDRHRNQLIVEHYMKQRKQYGKMICFAVNQAHAGILHQLFMRRDVKAGIVVSNAPNTQNDTIQKFRDGQLEVLINVNILTEGADFPDVQTVFLARPTTSKILMTQMIGRALRGVAAGGTSEAHIVSFIDDWEEKISFVNSQRLLEGPDLMNEAMEKDARAITTLISRQALEKLALQLENAGDTDRFTHITFSESVPIGIFIFDYLRKTKNGERSEHEEILVYEHQLKGFQKMKAQMGHVCSRYQSQHLAQEGVLREIVQEMEYACFRGTYKMPSVERHELKALVRYYAETKSFPTLLYLKDREQVDLTQLATEIVEKDLGPKAKAAYLKTIWQRRPFLQLYFNYDEWYFRKCIDEELLRMELAPHALEDVSLTVWKKEHPALYRRIVKDLLQRAKVTNGYRCMRTGRVHASTNAFEIRYEKPLQKGGKTELANLLLVIKKGL